MNRPAGTGWVTQTLKKDDGSFYLSVQYHLDNTKHGMIPISDVTTIPLDLRQSSSELIRKAAEDCGRDAQIISKTTISQSFKAKSKIEILKSALSEGLVKKKTKGWHRLNFGLNEKENNGKKFLRLNPIEKSSYFMSTNYWVSIWGSWNELSFSGIMRWHFEGMESQPYLLFEQLNSQILNIVN